MRKRANPTTIGIFVLGAVLLAVLAVVVLGAGRIFQKKHEYVLYFEGDVNGLRVGAPVKFKGVEVGQVTRILININISQEPRPVSRGIKIPVIIELLQGWLIRHGATQVNLDDPAVLKYLIQAGLRGQLAMESFVTGLMYVDLDMHPGTAANMVLPPGAPYEEIPTIPTPLQQAQSALTLLISQLEEADFKKLAATTRVTLDAVSHFASSPELMVAVQNLPKLEDNLSQAAVGIQRITARLDKEISPLATNLRSTTQHADDALIQARATLGSVQTVVDKDSPLVYETDKTLEDVAAAARSLRQLADYLQRNPSAPLRGKSLPGSTR